MEEGYVVGAVKVPKAIRFYTIRAGQQAACEAELAKRGLQVVLWAEAPTEHEAMQKAAHLMALQAFDRA